VRVVGREARHQVIAHPAVFYLLFIYNPRLTAHYLPYHGLLPGAQRSRQATRKGQAQDGLGSLDRIRDNCLLTHETQAI